MRDRIFRGFHPDEMGTKKVLVNDKWIKGEWVEGYYDGGYSIRLYYGRINTYADIERATGKDYVLITPETIGEYSGRTDKNGRKIYEGDIVDCRYVGIRYPAQVVFDNGSFGVTYTHNGVKYTNSFTSYVDSAVFEVVGNIYGTPELLEVETNE